MTELSRRQWMRLVGAGAAAAAAGCGDNDELALAVLEPTPDALLVSVWAPSAREVALDVHGPDGVTHHTVAIAATGTGALDLRGLAPATAYTLIAATAAARSAPHRARTAPRDDDPRPIRLAIAADLDTDPAFDSDLADHVAAAAPDLLVTLGDFPYADNPPLPRDAAGYRARHADTRTHPRVRRLLEAMPLRAIYDDHELINDWDARLPPGDPRRDGALGVWDEFFPLRDAATAGEVRYRRWRYGAHAECFLLDCRRFRAASTDPDDAAKSMLGAGQRAWLLEAVAASPATFKLIFTPVPLAFAHGRDAWTGYTVERDAIFAALAGVRGVLFLSADQHWFAAHRHAGGIRELQFGPFSRGVAVPPPLAPGVLFRAERFNAGLIDIDGDRLAVAAIGPGGERLYEEVLTAGELTPA